MKQRILTALAILAVIIPVFIFSRTPVYPILLALVALAATFEVLRVFGREKDYAVSLPLYLVALAAPFCAYFPSHGWELSPALYLGIVAAAFFALMLYLFAVTVFRHGTERDLPFSSMAECFTAALYIILSLTSLSLVRYLPQGEYYFLMVFLGSWVCDVFAYFTGYFFGKHKLIPRVSPKKTVEGSLGGTVFAVASFLLYGFLVGRFFGAQPDYLRLAVIGLVLAVVGQIGDLIASVIKREHEVKDYSNLLPGHGGIMDRFDSVISVSAVLVLLCLVFPPFS